jgi:hypothetical protein
LAIATNSASFLASWTCFATTLSALTVPIPPWSDVNTLQRRIQPLLLFPSFHSLDQAFALIPNDMPLLLVALHFSCLTKLFSCWLL